MAWSILARKSFSTLLGCGPKATGSGTEGENDPLDGGETVTRPMAAANLRSSEIHSTVESKR